MLENKKLSKVIPFLFIFSQQTIAATALGSGFYYDEGQINKLAQQYPARVSKDAGYPLIDNYSTLKSSYKGSQFGLTNKAIITGLWWTPLLAVDKNTQSITDNDYLSPLLIIPNPLTIKLNENGVNMGIPLQKANIDAAHIDRGYENTLDLSLTTNDLTGTAPLVQDYSDWMVKAQWALSNKPLLSVNIVEGSPFVFIEKKANQSVSYLRFNNSIDAKLLMQAEGLSLFKTKNASDANYRYYAYYSNPAGNINNWNDDTGVITPIASGGSGNIVPATFININDPSLYLSVAAIPAASDTDAINLAKTMQAYAYNFINSTSVNYYYDKNNAKVITNFNFQTKQVYNNSSLKANPLVMAFPWQIKNMNAATTANCLLKDNCTSATGTIQTLKGTMHLFEVASNMNNGYSFSIEIPFNGVLPLLPNNLNEAELEKLKSYSFNLEADPHLDAKNPWTDTYATGKILSKEAQLIKIADQLAIKDSSYKQVRDQLLAKLKGQVNSFLTGLNYTDACPNGGTNCVRAEAAWFYSYNPKWHTLMGFPSGFFTATTLTDHPFHWGYLVDAAATIAQFDKNWAMQYGAMINLIIRDIWNYKYGQTDSTGIKLPHFRSFDPYTGLSSALGMPYSLDNNNEEDSAEFMNLAQAIILWGTNTEGLSFNGDDTNPENLLETGLYLYTTEEQGLNHYHFNRNPSSGVFPADWSNNATQQSYQIVGNVWGGKQDRSTYFCAGTPCYYQNLASNTLPISAGSLYLGLDPAFVNKAYVQDAKNPCSGDTSNSAYCGTLLKYLALGNPTNALTYFKNYFDQFKNQPDPGESLASIYYWIQNLNNLGTINMAINADVPSFAAFGSNDKLYVAGYNGGINPKNISFYKNGVLTCVLENVQPGEIKSGACNNTTPNPNPPQQLFSYTIYLGYPFKSVLINNSITCPSPVTKNPACKVDNIAAGSVMTIQGSNGNFCSLAIAKTGVVTPNTAQSKGCNINSQPAGPSTVGVINLPAGF